MKTTALILFVSTLVACAPSEEGSPQAPSASTAPPAGSTSGAEHGKLLIQQYGCMTCHIVPGIKGPRGMVGPSLEAFASRPTILDKVPNTPDNLVRYLQNPQSVDPQTSMPNLAIGADEARDIASYLTSLK